MGLDLGTWPSFTHGPWPDSYSCCRQVVAAEPVTQSAPFSIFGITSLQIWMPLNIVSAIPHFRYYKPSASHAGETVYLLSFAHLILRLCYLDLGVLWSLLPSVSHAGESLQCPEQLIIVVIINLGSTSPISISFSSTTPSSKYFPWSYYRLPAACT